MEEIKAQMAKRREEEAENIIHIDFAQDFLPIKNVAHGVIETRDGRYLKILEIQPSNFLLMSQEEQDVIIAAFARWLHVSPITVQYKCMSRKADTEGHMRRMEKLLAQEKTPRCAAMIDSYLKLIRNMQANGAITQRYFVIFQCEGVVRNGNEEEARALLEEAEMQARQFFRDCRCPILRWRNPDMAIAEIFYTFYNRRSCIEQPFISRLTRVVDDTMRAQGLDRDKDPIPPINIADLIAPRGLDFTHKDYMIMDGTYYSFSYITSSGYPTKVGGSWPTILSTAAEGIDVDIYLQKEDSVKINRKITRMLEDAASRDYRATDSTREHREDRLAASWKIRRALSSDGEDFFYMTTLVTVSAPTIKKLKETERMLILQMESKGFTLKKCQYFERDAFDSITPLCHLSPMIKRRSARNILTSSAASCYMYSSLDVFDESGVVLGINRYNGTIVALDLFNTRRAVNANAVIFGSAGSGKTYFMSCLAMRLRYTGIQVFAIAPMKGHEFQPMCEHVGGTFIRISPGSPHVINPFEIRPMKQTNYSAMTSLLLQKLKTLLAFFTLRVADLTFEEEQYIEKSIMDMYRDFGVTRENASVLNPDGSVKKMPTMEDYCRYIDQYPELKRVRVALDPFLGGQGSYLNGQTNVDLENKFIVFDLSDAMDSKLLPMTMLTVFDLIRGKIQEDRTQRKALFFDEVWSMVATTTRTEASDVVVEAFKTFRGYNASVIAATQDVEDVFSGGRTGFGSAMVSNSATSILLRMNKREADAIQDVFGINDDEKMSLQNLSRGEAILFSGSTKLPLIVRGSFAEDQAINLGAMSSVKTEAG